MRILNTLIAPGCLLAAATAVPAQEDAQVAYNSHCRTCHSLDAGDNRLGPTLHGVLGRKAGSVEGYRFSRSMAASNIVWDAETLDAFIEDPDAVVPGHQMRPYSGIGDADIRAAIVSALGG